MIIKYCVHNCMLLFLGKGVSRSHSLLRIQEVDGYWCLVKDAILPRLHFKVYAEKLVNKIKIKIKSESEKLTRTDKVDNQKEKRCIFFVCVSFIVEVFML